MTQHIGVKRNQGLMLTALFYFIVKSFKSLFLPIICIRKYAVISTLQKVHHELVHLIQLSWFIKETPGKESDVVVVGLSAGNEAKTFFGLNIQSCHQSSTTKCFPASMELTFPSMYL